MTLRIKYPALTLLLSLLLTLTSGCDWFFGLESDQPFAVGEASKLGGDDNERGLAVAMDTSGQAVVAGSFSSKTLSIGKGSLTSSGGADIFVAGFKTAGGISWAKSAGGPGLDRAWGVAVNNDGDMFIVGHFNAKAMFDGAGELTPYMHTGGTTPADTLFVARLDGKTHKFTWAKRLGMTGSSTTLERRISVALNGSGSVYVAGGFIHSKELDTKGTGLSSRGGEDIFLAKLNAKGEVVWARTTGSAGTDRAQGVVNDGAGGALITGLFEQTVTFSGASTTLTSAGEQDVLVARYDAGGTLLWAKSAGGTRDDQGTSLGRDQSGNAIVAGTFRSAAASFGAAGKVSAVGGSDMFVANLDSAGAFTWVTAGGGVDDAAALGIAVDPQGGSLVTGYFQGLVTFGPYSLASRGTQDMFLARLSSSGEFIFFAPIGGDGALTTGHSVSVGLNASGLATGSFDGDLSYGGVNLTSSGKADVLLVALKPKTSVEDGGVDVGDRGIIADQKKISPDTTAADMADPDMANSDMTAPDMAGLDMADPDMAGLDMVTPDTSSTPDMATPDMVAPDLVTPDMVTPDAVEEWGGA